MKIDQYFQRQRCKHVELEQFLACVRVARVCQRQLGFLVMYYLHTYTSLLQEWQHFLFSTPRKGITRNKQNITQQNTTRIYFCVLL